MSKKKEILSTCSPMAHEAFKCLFSLACDEKLDVKLRCDLLKWICEMCLGKPSSAKVENQASAVKNVVFKGELEKWSEN